MRRPGRILIGLAALCAISIVGAALLLHRGDIAYDVLRGRYANNASRFSLLPGGAAAHFRDEGAPGGRTLVLIHGFGGSLHGWEPWVASLGGKYRLVSVDLPGHGLTQAPKFIPTIENYADFLEAFAEVEGLDRISAVGAGLGGTAAAAWAHRRPERVEALVLIAPGGSAPRDDDFQWIAHPLAAPAMERLNPFPVALYALSVGIADPTRGRDAPTRRYADLARAPGHRRALLQAAALRPALALPPHAPALILHGAEDPFTSAAAMRQFAAANPAARLQIYGGVGHFPHEEAAQRAATDADAFLSAVLSSAPPR